MLGLIMEQTHLCIVAEIPVGDSAGCNGKLQTKAVI